MNNTLLYFSNDDDFNLNIQKQNGKKDSTQE